MPFPRSALLDLVGRLGSQLGNATLKGRDHYVCPRVRRRVQSRNLATWWSSATSVCAWLVETSCDRFRISKKVKPQQGTPSPRSNLATPGDDDVF